ncbi:MAG: CheR family methyltransferase [Pseudomonadota bacterium]
MILAKLESLLKKTMGLNADSIGASAIERAAQERCAACGLDNVQAYWEQVRSSETELQALVEAIVVAETWFFRDREAFAALLRIIEDEWFPTHRNGVLRLLSVPCSTGEEPYSLAMTLLDAGIAARQFCIDAVDISERALATARGGLYGQNSFRGSDLSFRNRYFTTTAQGHRLADVVRETVRFRQANIFAPDFLAGAGSYDVIFCRNLLIYFDRPTQDRAIEILEHRLADKGMLFVGPAETSLLQRPRFVSMKIPRAFAFRKADALVQETKPSAALAVKPLIKSPLVRVVKPAPALRAITAPIDVSKKAPESRLDQASRLADLGRLDEAAALCEQHLRAHGPSVSVFYLLGLVYDASGNYIQANTYYRKVLYLEPDHSETLIHLACLLEKQGDNTGARLLHERLKRAKPKSQK